MGLTAQQVRNKAFRTVRQVTGYDIDEVDAFLEQVEAELARTGDEGSGGDSARSAAGILELAQRTADDAVAQARSHAERIVEEAELRAVEEVTTLRAQREQLRAEVEALMSRVDSLRALEGRVRDELAAFLESRLIEVRGPSGAVGNPHDADVTARV